MLTSISSSVKPNVAILNVFAPGLGKSTAYLSYFFLSPFDFAQGKLQSMQKDIPIAIGTKRFLPALLIFKFRY